MHMGRDRLTRAGPEAFVPGLAVRQVGAVSARLVLRICNHAHIEWAYGARAAGEVAAEIQRRLTAAFPMAANIVIEPGGTFAVDLLLDQAGAEDAVEALLPSWLSTFCITMLGQPIATGEAEICAWLSADWTFAVGRNGRILPFAGPPVGEGPDAAAIYRSDMALFAKLVPLLGGDVPEAASRNAQGLVLHWQPVVGGNGRVLYHEALCRPCDGDDDGSVRSPEGLLLALERLGFVCLLDRYVVSSVIDELEDAPGVALAANVSAQSLSCTQSWGDVLDRLERRPDIARRLVWEITETALVADMNRASAFVAAVKALGCRIAIDDFGVGFASIRQLLVFAPEIIKIDRLFLDRAVLSPRDASIFLQMVELARSFGAEVVVEGIETRAQAELVEAAGPVWQQGYLHAVPSLTRLWRQGWGSGDRLEAPR